MPRQKLATFTFTVELSMMMFGQRDGRKGGVRATVQLQWVPFEGAAP
jgi:hypothetical protein